MLAYMLTYMATYYAVLWLLWHLNCLVAAELQNRGQWKGKLGALVHYIPNRIFIYRLTNA